jgi:type I restriction enzyme S subunit
MSSEWTRTTVGEFCPFKYGKGLPERNRKSGAVSVFSSAGLVGSHNVALVQSQGVVIGRKGTVGSITFASEAFWPIDTAFYIEDQPHIRNIRFTYYLLKTLGLHLMNTDSAVPGLNRENAHALEILVPSLNVQKCIADLLQELDDRITLLRETNKTLESIAQAIFKSWFVDFDPVHAKAKGIAPEGMDEATAALFPDSFEETELGKVPKGWRIRPVGELLNRPRVVKRYTKIQVKEFGKHPVFEQGASILLGFHDDVPSCMATPEKPLFIFGDHTCVTKLSCEPFDVSQNVILLEGAKRNSFWTYYAIQGKQSFQEYRRHWMELITKKVVAPPSESCDLFSSYAAPLQLKIEGNSKIIHVLINIRDTLLPRLISGQLRIEEAQEMVESV